MITNNENLGPRTGIKYGVKQAEKLSMDKGNKSHLLKRSSSQISLIGQHFDDNERRMSHVLIPSSSTYSAGNSFTKPVPLSSFPEQRARSKSFPRPKTSGAFVNRDTGRNGSEPVERKKTNAKTKLLPTKGSLQSRFRRASCFTLQAHRRVSLEGPPRLWRRNVPRGREFMGVVTSRNEGEDEEEKQIRRKRVSEICCSISLYCYVPVLTSTSRVNS